MLACHQHCVTCSKRRSHHVVYRYQWFVFCWLRPYVVLLKIDNFSTSSILIISTKPHPCSTYFLHYSNSLADQNITLLNIDSAQSPPALNKTTPSKIKQFFFKFQLFDKSIKFKTHPSQSKNPHNPPTKNSIFIWQKISFLVCDSVFPKLNFILKRFYFVKIGFNFFLSLYFYYSLFFWLIDFLILCLVSAWLVSIVFFCE